MWIVVEQQLQVARLLAQVSEEGPFEASLRRAVSTAYYAIFQALCDMCAESMVGSERARDAFSAIFRALEHGPAALALGHEFVRTELGLARLYLAFKELKEAREWADYDRDSRPGARDRTTLPPFSREDALNLIDSAEEAIKMISALDDQTRLRLAARLLVKSRK